MGLKKRRVLILTLLVASFCHLTVQAQTITEKEFQAIRQVALNIPEKCAPGECLIIGVGRSPTPFIAYLQALSENYAFNLPLTAFRHFPDSAPVQSLVHNFEDQSRLLPLSPALEVKLFRHFADMIPLEIVGKMKAIVMVDQSDTGLSLLAAASYYRKFLNQKNLAVDMRVVGIGNHDDQAKLLRNSETLQFQARFIGADELSVGRSKTLSSNLVVEHYDDFSQFGEFKIEKHNSPQRGSGKYESLKADLNKWNALDAESSQLKGSVNRPSLFEKLRAQILKAFRCDAALKSKAIEN